MKGSLESNIEGSLGAVWMETGRADYMLVLFSPDTPDWWTTIAGV